MVQPLRILNRSLPSWRFLTQSQIWLYIKYFHIPLKTKATRAKIAALRARLGHQSGVVGTGSPGGLSGGDVGSVASIALRYTYHQQHYIPCPWGDFHHQPLAAGTFVPGHASASVGDPDLPKTRDGAGLTSQASTESLNAGGPTPRKLVLSPAPTTLDRADSKDSYTVANTPKDGHGKDVVIEIQSSMLPPILPDNQLGLEETHPPSPVESGPPIPETPDNTEHPETEEVPPEKGEGSGGTPIVLQGTMYDDGTYWKTLGCD